MDRIFSTPRTLLAKTAALLGALVLATGLLTGCLIGYNEPKSVPTVRVGTMPTEDILPLWVAESEDLFAPYDMEVQLVTFDSAQTLSAAIIAGEVDMAMTDIMRAVKLCEMGAPVEVEWITLGTTPEQGRFGILVGPDSSVTSLADLAASGIAVAANTVPEYVFEKLCENSGIDPETIEHLEAPSLPERYALTASGQYAAAALPNSLLALGEAQGMTVIADDTQGENLSQSVMVAVRTWAASHTELIASLAKAWDEAAALINADPDAYRPLLIENANINSAVADTYPVSTYPDAFADDGTTLLRAPAELVEPVAAWMEQKGYTGASVAYDEETGTFTLS